VTLDHTHLSAARDWLDVTLPLRQGMPLYPGDPPLALTPWSSLEAGAPFAVSALALGTHTGTHVDAPAHCISGGAGVDHLPLEALCGPAVVLDLAVPAAIGGIGPALLETLPDDCERLLLRTQDGRLWAGEVLLEVGLTEAGAALLIERGVRLVGIDRLSIAPASDPLPVHRALLAAGVVILEGLDLRAVPAGPCELFCLPLKLAGADGAPARVALRY
jgi:arylformamidase